MIELRTLSEQEKPTFRQANIDAMLAGFTHYERANEDQVLSFCENQIDAEIANAEQSPLETILTIVKKDTNEVLGSLWYRLHNEAVYSDLVYVCWLGIYPDFRRLGFAKAALAQLEMDLKKQGITRMALQAFNHHLESMKLYKSVGFEAKRTILHKYF